MSTPFHIPRFDHAGVMLNLTGYRDDEECVIERVTAADSEIDLYEIFTISALRSMAECVDAQLSAGYRAERVEQRAELRQWHRDMACA